MRAQALPYTLSSAIPSIRWPLDPSLSPPLYFQSLEAMHDVRSKQQAATASIRLDRSHKLVSDLPFTLEELFPKADADRRSFGLVSVALILLGNGLTDEAHDLVTPLSWPEDTHFGFGNSIYSQVSPAAKSYATYVHCLIHRREGSHVGEFGMVGYQNAAYWSNAVKQSPGVVELPHQCWIEQVRKLLNDFQSHQAIQEWGREHGFFDKSLSYFESRAIHQLCARVMSEDPKDSDAVLLRDFAEKVAETELRILLAHALQRAGYDCSLESVLRPSEQSQEL